MEARTSRAGSTLAFWNHPIHSVTIQALAQVTSFRPSELAHGGGLDKVIWLGGVPFAWNPCGLPDYPFTPPPQLSAHSPGACYLRPCSFPLACVCLCLCVLVSLFQVVGPCSPRLCLVFVSLRKFLKRWMDVP